MDWMPEEGSASNVLLSLLIALGDPEKDVQDDAICALRELSTFDLRTALDELERHPGQFNNAARELLERIIE